MQNEGQAGDSQALSPDFDTLDDSVQIIPPSSKHTASVLFLHGFKANPSEFKNYLESFCGLSDPTLRNVGLSHVKWIFPPGTFLGDQIDERAWFHKIQGLLYDSQEQDIDTSRVYLHRLIRNEIKSGIKANRIILGGFSQGGSISLYTGLTYDGPEKLGGIFCLSGRLIRRNQLPSKIGESTKDIKILWAHGNPDNVNPFPGDIDSEIRTLLGSDYKDLTLLEYLEIGHDISELEMKQVLEWIAAQVPDLPQNVFE